MSSSNMVALPYPALSHSVDLSPLLKLGLWAPSIYSYVDEATRQYFTTRAFEKEDKNEKPECER